MHPAPLSDWKSALTDFASSPASVGYTVFFERRVDLRLELTGDREIVPFPAWTSGLALRSHCRDRPSIYLSDPHPHQLQRGAKIVGSRKSPRRNAPGGIEFPDSHTLRATLDGMLSELDRRRLPPRGRVVAYDQTILVAGHGGAPAEDRRTGRRLRIETGGAVVERDIRNGVPDPVDLVDRLAARAARSGESREAATGSFETVLAPGVGGVLVHELIGHALEGDAILVGRSWLPAFLETRRADERWTVIDDPRRGRAPARIDDEGTPTRATPLLRGGRVAGGLHSVATAARAGCEPTGHGRVGGYRDPVLPRMGATFVASNEGKREDIVRGVSDGICVWRMEAGHTDTERGHALFRVTEADRIRGGRIAEPLLPFVMQIDGRDLLSRPVVIGEDLRFDTCIGSCHKEGQPLVVTVGAPTIWLEVAKVRGPVLNPEGAK